MPYPPCTRTVAAPRTARVPIVLVAGLVSAVLSAAVSVVVTAGPAGAVSDGGTPGPPPATAGSSRYRPPVDRPVVDPFRAPVTRYGPGNRGLEYATVPGALAEAIGDGVVAFAGDVAGRGVVTVVHPDGLRSSLTGLVVVLAHRGQVVARGAPLGTTGALLHLGVRSGGRYIDPAQLFGDDRPRHAVLVPTRSHPALGAPAPR